MPLARAWTEQADMTIRGMRGGGATWAEIARTLGLSRNTVIERGRRLRALAPARILAADPAEVALEDPNRGALRAGHPLTWGLLMREPYPEGGVK